MRRHGFILTTSCLALSVASAVVLLWPPAIAAAQNARNSEIAVADTVEDIEIMRLVLVRVLKESVSEHMAAMAPVTEVEPAEPLAVTSTGRVGTAGGAGGGGGVGGGAGGGGLAVAGSNTRAAERLLDNYTRSAGAYTTGVGRSRGRQVTSNTRGFYAEGLGAIFSTEVAVPVRAVNVDEDEPDRADLWREAQREHEGRGSGYSSFTVPAGDESHVAIDEEAMDAAIDAVIEAIGEYGVNIAGLSPDESIVVAMHFEGSGSGLLSQTGSGRWLAIAGGSRRATAVVRVSVADVQQYADGKYNRKTLRSRAVVTKY
jgi:hypothetical protein